MTIRTSRAAALGCALLATTCLVTPARAQTAPPPRFQILDDNGVNLVSGRYEAPFVEGVIGSGEGAVSLERNSGGPDQWSGLLYRTTINGQSTIVVEFGPIADTFTNNGSSWVSTKADGATLSPSSGGTWVYTARDGTKILYDSINMEFNDDGLLGDATPYQMDGPGCASADPGTCAIPRSITKPDGMVFTLNWDFDNECGGRTLPCPDPKAYFRFKGVTSSANYRFSRTYLTNDPGPYSAPQSDWYVRTGATFGTPTTTLGTVSYAHPSTGVEEVTDSGGRVWRLTNASDGSYRIRRPGSAADDVIVTFAPTGGTVASVTRDGVTTSYARTVSGSTGTITTTDAFGHHKTIVSNLSLGRPTAITDELGHTTSYTYDSNARLTRVTEPEGNYTQYTYDPRGNITETRQVAKAGSGLADIVTTAGYDASCTSPAKCDKPNWTKDAAGHQTDYTYNSSTGRVTSVTLPAPVAGGVRPQTRYTYATSGVAMLTGISQCRTGASCAGGADEVKTIIAYNANLLPSSVSVGAGNGSLTATSTATYDGYGDLLTIDGPLAGPADTSRYRYNSARELVGTVSPDPDGTGALMPRAVRYTRDGAGKVTRIETGTVADQSDAAWAAFAPAEAVTTTYDGNDRKVTEALSSGGTTYALTHYGYDALGRAECTAVRMNSAAFASLPASACALGTQGSFGPDRITRNTYDAAGRLLKVTEAYGTAEQADEVTRSYTANGQVATLKDAENNLTSYSYDGFDRLSQTFYPLPTKGAGASSTTDYERLGYDANGNVVSRRLRDGQVIAFSYDALNRVTLKDVPNAVPYEYDISYAYDNLGRLISATDTNPYIGSATTTLGYDALGRVTSELSRPFGTKTYQYDLAGRRTRMTWPDGMFVTYDHLVTGEVSAIRENGSLALASFGYDDLGRRTSLTYGDGSATSYGYDPVSRLAQLTQDLAGTADDLTLGFSYSPASQIASNTRSNDAYAWTGHGSGTTGSTANGLNQLVTLGGATLTYDARGNMTNDGVGHGYAYTSENRLANASGTEAAHDPLGRLFWTSTGRFFDYDTAGRGGAMVTEMLNGQIARRFVFGPGVDEPLVWYEGPGTSDRRYLHADERGSIVAVTDSAGNVIGRNTYDEYGKPGSGNIGRFQYTGQKWIPELGLYDYKARMYDPDFPVFMQPDPLGYINGPNWYPYVSDDPINLFDPSGTSCSEIVAAHGGCNPNEDAARQYVANHLSFLSQEDQDRIVGYITDYLDFDLSFADVKAAITSIAAGEIFVLAHRSAGETGSWVSDFFSGGLVGLFGGGGATGSWGKPCGCFEAGTLVATPAGLKPIEDIKVGDLVLSQNDENGEIAAKKVIGLIRPEPKQLYELTLRDASGESETFHATDDHPWKVEGKGWVETRNLHDGDRIDTASSQELTLLSLEQTNRIERTYNLTVVDWHTFLVGEDRAVVHNGDCYKTRIPGKSGKEAAKDVPSWVKGQAPFVGESGRDFAERLLNDKYGLGNYKTGPGSEFQKIQKYADRGFE